MFTNSLDGLANVLALICAVLITPTLDHYTSAWATQAFTATYGSDLEDLFQFCWFLIVGAAVFFTARAGIALALMMVSGWAVLRFGMLA